jgi:NADH:ubiquinone oxidoreductase subunit 6 (subunit J)
MNLQNIIKIVSGLLGVLGAILLIRIMSLGDDQIKMDASMGDYSSISPLINLALFILAIAVVVTLIFSIITLASDSKKLKKSLIASGLFLLVIAISYGVSEGVETPMKDDKILSASGSRLVGTGIVSFYILTVIAFGSMMFSSIKRIIKK